MPPLPFRSTSAAGPVPDTDDDACSTPAENLAFAAWLRDTLREIHFDEWCDIVSHIDQPGAELVILACATVKANMSKAQVAQHVIGAAPLGVSMNTRHAAQGQSQPCVVLPFAPGQ